MQIVKKFLANGAIAKLLNNVYVQARNAANTSDVDVFKVNASDKIQFGSLPQASGTPTVNDDLVNKGYVDSVVVAPQTPGAEEFVLTSTDITNQYVNLPDLANTESIMLFVSGVMQRQGTDYTAAPSGGVTRISFINDLATGGAAALVANDVVIVHYTY